MIRGLIFDYGGTLDSSGQHWASVIQEAYTKVGVSIDPTVYEEAYVYAERKMATHPLILPHYNFRQMLETKVEAQFAYLTDHGHTIPAAKIQDISAEAFLVAQYHAQKSKAFLAEIYGSMPLVIVSNFYGNLKAVLQDFGLLSYFDTVIESAVIGIRKPDPAIFQCAVDELNLPAAECLVVGDSYRKDIVPAKACGCQTLWLKGKVWGDETALASESAADHIVSDFEQLADFIRRSIPQNTNNF